jgi:hypothetical protein
MELSTEKLLPFGFLKFKSRSMQSVPKELKAYFTSLSKGNGLCDHCSICVPDCAALAACPLPPFGLQKA